MKKKIKYRVILNNTNLIEDKVVEVECTAYNFLQKHYYNFQDIQEDGSCITKHLFSKSIVDQIIRIE